MSLLYFKFELNCIINFFFTLTVLLQKILFGEVVIKYVSMYILKLYLNRQPGVTFLLRNMNLSFEVLNHAWE